MKWEEPIILAKAHNTVYKVFLSICRQLLDNLVIICYAEYEYVITYINII